MPTAFEEAGLVTTHVPGPFTAEEYRERIENVRARMRELGVEALLLASPEDIYYLVGLNHQGYFAFTLLLLPARGRPLLITRSMERATLVTQAPDADHVGFPDDEEPATAVVHAVSEIGLATARLGIAKNSMYLPVSTWERVAAGLPRVTWADVSGLVTELRLVKSPAELSCIRQAAALSDRAMRAGVLAAGVGVNEREVAAEVYRAMVVGGSEYPGFAPLIRSTENLSHEHETWRDRVLVSGDRLFLELSASVARYHAPLTRVVYLGHAPQGADRVADVSLEGLEAVRAALRPGIPASDVYAAWQAVVDRALPGSGYRRHHCGYVVGIGFPPSWVGGSSVIGIRPGSTTVVQESMVFHVLSWVLGVGDVDYGVSDTIVVTADGGELLTSTARRPVTIA